MKESRKRILLIILSIAAFALASIMFGYFVVGFTDIVNNIDSASKSIFYAFIFITVVFFFLRELFLPLLGEIERNILELDEERNNHNKEMKGGKIN